jgi:hypothetical protein
MSYEPQTWMIGHPRKDEIRMIDHAGKMKDEKSGAMPLIFHLSSFIFHLSSFIFHLSSFIFHLSSIVGLSGVEPLTSRLSGGRSNQLSYRPLFQYRIMN